MALVAVIGFFFGFIAFNVGGTTPEGGTGTPVPNTAPARAAKLALRSARPLVVVGSRFTPAERVRVTAAGTAKTVRAARSGQFVVRFVGVDPCNGVTIVARGSAGSRATLTFG